MPDDATKKLMDDAKAKTGALDSSEEAKERHGLNEDSVAGIDVEVIPGMLCNGICPGAPECVTMDHQWHFSEAIFVLIGVVVALMLCLRFAGLDAINSIVFGSTCVACSFFSLIYLWNFHHQATLARLAAVFETIVKASEENLKKLKENNAEHKRLNQDLTRQNDELNVQNNELLKSAGLLEKTQAEMDKVLDRVDKVVDAQRKMVDLQKKLNDDEKQFMRFQKQNQLHVKANQIKMDARRAFDACDVNRSGDIEGKRETKRLYKMLDRINGVKKYKLDWEESLFDTDKDGKLLKAELMETIDAELDQKMTLEWQEANNK